MVFVDTSVLVDSFTGDQQAAPAFRRALQSGERLAISTLVLYEWLRGPRIVEELALLESTIPSAHAIPFGPADAALSAKLYRSVSRPRGREVDLAIAACAINRQALIWTMNRADFADIPGVTLYRAG